MYSAHSQTLRAAARRARGRGRPIPIAHQLTHSPTASTSGAGAGAGAARAGTAAELCASCRSRWYHSPSHSPGQALGPMVEPECDQHREHGRVSNRPGARAQAVAEPSQLRANAHSEVDPNEVSLQQRDDGTNIAYVQHSILKPTRIANPIQLPVNAPGSANSTFFDAHLRDLETSGTPTTTVGDPVSFSHSLPLRTSPASSFSVASAPTTDQLLTDPTQPRPSGKIITADYRAPTLSQTSEARGAASTWDSTLRRCTNPIQLRVTVSRIFAQAASPKPVDIIAALNACARLALLGSKGVAPIMDRVASTNYASSSSRPGPAGGGSSSGSGLKAQQFQRESFEIAQSIMQSLVDRRMIPSLHMYTAYIRVCAHAGQVDAAFAALDDLKRNGLVPDTEIYKGLVMASARQGDLHRALQTVESSVQNTKTVSKHAKWLKMALRMAVGVEAGKWLGIVISLATDVNEIASQIIGIGFGTVFGLRLAIPVIMPVEKLGRASEANKAASQSSLVSPADSGYAGPTSHRAVAFPPDAYQDVANNAVFHSLDAHEVNEHMHNFLVAQLERSGNVDAALHVLDEMRNKGITVTIHTYNALVSDLVQLGKPELALATIAKMATVQPNAVTFIPVIMYYYDRRKFAATIRVYEDHVVPLGVQPDLFLYTSVISAYGKVDEVDKAMQVYDLFLRQGFVPNQFVLNTLISILAKNGRYREAEEVVLVTMAKHGVSPSVRSFCKLIDKAVTIDPESYLPPPSHDFQPPSIPSLLPSPKSPASSLSAPPIQVQRAWYWYQRLLSSGIPHDLVPIEFLLLVCGINGYGHVALHEYANAIRTQAFNGPLTPESLLLPREHAQEPSMHGYQRLAVAATRVEGMPLEASVALVYEIQERKAWPYAVPDPAAFVGSSSAAGIHDEATIAEDPVEDVARLVRLTELVKAQQHSSPVLSPLGGQPEGPLGMARRCTSILNNISARAVTDGGVSVSMKQLVVAMNQELITHVRPMVTKPSVTTTRTSNEQPDGSAVGKRQPQSTLVVAHSLVDEIAGTRTAPRSSALDMADDDDDDDDGVEISSTPAAFIPSPGTNALVPVGPSVIDAREIKSKPALLAELVQLMSKTKRLREQITSAGGSLSMTRSVTMGAPRRNDRSSGKPEVKTADLRRHSHQHGGHAHSPDNTLHARRGGSRYWSAVGKDMDTHPRVSVSSGPRGGVASIMRSALIRPKGEQQPPMPASAEAKVGDVRRHTVLARKSGQADDKAVVVKQPSSPGRSVHDFWTKV